MNSQTQGNFFSTAGTLNVAGRLVNLAQPRVMGILNTTPDSFYDGGRYVSEQEILRQTGKMLADGATFIDVGAYSTRPGAMTVSESEETDRAIKAVAAISREFPEAIISIDTFRSQVAHAAVDHGATIINDISSGDMDPALPQLAARHRLPYIAMHMRGTPETMSSMTSYNDLLKDVVDYFHAKLQALKILGLNDIIIDPGFGFAKTREQNFELLHKLPYFHILEKPVLVGLSRKSMVWKTLGIKPEDGLNGTTALHTIALINGANILRVHDVKEAMQVIHLVNMMSVGATTQD